MHAANKSIRLIFPRPQSSSIQTDDRCAFLFEKNNPQKLVFLLVLSYSSFLRGRLCGSIQLSNSDLLYLSIGASPILRVRSRRVKNDWYLVDGCVPLSRSGWSQLHAALTRLLSRSTLSVYGAVATAASAFIDDRRPKFHHQLHLNTIFCHGRKNVSSPVDLFYY